VDLHVSVARWEWEVPYVVMRISVSGLQEEDRIAWGLMLIQDARLSGVIYDKGVKETDVSSSENRAQLFSGTFDGPGPNRMFVRGSLVTAVSTNSAARSVVSFPE
jgi:hypothetical protein